MGCGDSKPEPPIEDLKPGDLITPLTGQWMFKDDGLNDTFMMINAGEKCEFISYGKMLPNNWCDDTKQGVKIKIIPAGGAEQHQGYTLSWERRGTKMQGDKDSRIKRIGGPGGFGVQIWKPYCPPLLVRSAPQSAQSVLNLA